MSGETPAGAADAPSRTRAGDTATRVDACGTVHRPVAGTPRIVSLVPSLTELLCDLGLADNVVGRTGFCIHPRDVVRHIPKLGGTKDVDVESLRALRPTHVIVNIDENRRELVAALEGSGAQLFVTHPVAPDDNLALFDSLGFVFRREREAAALAQRYTAARRRLGRFAQAPAENVLYLIWRDPWMTVGTDTYISHMLGLVNWTTQPREAEPRYPSIALADYAGRVDRVLLSSEPYPFRDKHLGEVRAVVGDDVPVELVDGEMLSWYGSRAIAGIDYLGQLVASTPGEVIA